MGFEPKYSVITACVQNLGDRFLTSGYKKTLGLAERLQGIGRINGVSGVELCHDPDGDEGNVALVRKLLVDTGLQVSVVNAPLVGSPVWKYGTFSAPDASVRREALETARRTIDFAEAVGAACVNLWLGQDGFDYPFQADYGEQWKHMVEGVRACADWKPSIRIALEFKPREPRNRALIDSSATSLLLIGEVDRPNVGVTIDNGHVLQAGGNMAQAVELCARVGKLYNMHLNDNYAAWDDDMIVGSVHLLEYLELAYVLRKVGYAGWCSIDIFPFREDGFRATEESIAFLESYDLWVERVGMEKIAALVRAGDVTETLRAMRTSLFR